MERCWHELGLLNLVVLPAILKRLPRPQPGQDLQSLVEHIAACSRVGLLTEVIPLKPPTSAAHAQYQPPTGEPVKRDGFAGQLALALREFGVRDDA